MLYLIALQHLVGEAASNNLTSVVVKALQSSGGFDFDAIATKLLCFRVDGCLLFTACIME